MNQLDAVLLVLLVPFAFRGYARGLCRESLGLVGSIAGLFVAGAFGPQLGKVLLEKHLVPAVGAQPVGWMVVFFGTWLVAALLGRLADRLASALLLGGLNRFAGMLFGSAKGAALLGFTLLLIEQAAPSSSVSRAIAQSQLGRPLEHMAGSVAQTGRELGIAPAERKAA
jgi:membrane protein required for colicin V production